jgi:hypothetical protein
MSSKHQKSDEPTGKGMKHQNVVSKLGMIKLGSRARNITSRYNVAIPPKLVTAEIGNSVS